MIQIKETDFLWKCYCYHHRTNTMHPHSVCNYLWGSLAGIAEWILWDASFFIVFGILVTLFIILNEYLISYFVLGVLISFYLVRLWGFCSTKGKPGLIINTICGIIYGICGFTFFVSLAFVENGWHFSYFFLSLLSIGLLSVLTGVIMLIVLLVHKCSTSEVIKAYLFSFKSWACPIVKAPWEDVTVPNPNEQSPNS